MPFFDPLHPLPSSVLEILSAHRDISIEDLQKHLQSEYKLRPSKQNLYRTVSLLIEHQVLVRNNAKLALNHVWVAHLTKFSETLQRTYQNHEQLEFWIPQKDGQVREYFADSLAALDPIWNDGLLRLAQMSESRQWYVYNSHPWYALGMYETEYRLYKSIVASKIKCHMLYGNETFLDLYGQKALRVDGFHTACGKASLFDDEGHALWVCDEFLVECKMPPAIARHFAFFFQNTQRVEDFDPQLFSDLFRMKARCKIQFSKNAKDAERYRSQLEKFF